MLQAAGDSRVGVGGVGVGVGVDVDDFIQSLPEIIGTANSKLSPATIIESSIIPTTHRYEQLKFLIVSTVDQKNIGTLRFFDRIFMKTNDILAKFVPINSSLHSK
ncbi:unnamed protein product, partial [Heterotrigona itama]